MEPCAQWALLASTARRTRVCEHFAQQDSHKLSHVVDTVLAPKAARRLGVPPSTHQRWLARNPAESAR